jgi:hypothetical protein
MNIRITAILIILALIFTVIFFYFFAQDSKISELIITQDPLSTTKTENVFTDRSREIFLLIKLSKIKKGQEIKISWFKKIDNNNLLLIQDNSIFTDNKGSGFLQISLADKNGSYESGSYQIKVTLNGNPEKPFDFKIN